jgi:DNA polymerase IV
MDRAIIHLNVADFAVAVERVVDSRLKNRPVIIAPEGAARSVVYDMSDDAFLVGVRKGMPLRRALRICKDAFVLPPHQDRYERAMKAFFKHTLPYSPLTETGGDDGHLFVDVTGSHRLFGPPMDVAWRLRKEIRKDLGLDPIWSVAPNKLVAKVATRLVKPTGEYIVAAGEEETFLAPLPLYLIPGIEKDDFLRLAEFDFTKVSQVVSLSLKQLQILFGNRSNFLYDTLRGIDFSPVFPAENNKPIISLDHEFGDDTNDIAKVESVLYRLVEKSGKQLRHGCLAARRLALVIGYSDGLRCIRQKKADPATSNDMVLFDLAREILGLAWFRRVRIRHLRLICDRLIFPPAHQLEIFPQSFEKNRRRSSLMKAIDSIRSRFGDHAIRTGRTWGDKKDKISGLRCNAGFVSSPGRPL